MLANFRIHANLKTVEHIGTCDDLDLHTIHILLIIEASFPQALEHFF